MVLKVHLVVEINVAPRIGPLLCLALRLHPSFHLQQLVTSHNLKRSSGELTSRIIIHWCSCHWVVHTAISSRNFVPQMLISQSCCSGLSILTAAFSPSIHWLFVSDMGRGMSFMEGKENAD